MKPLTRLALAVFILTSALAAQLDKGYVASKLRDPFHKPSCKWAQKISPQNLQSFKTREEAVAGGHRPCKVCKP